MKLFQNKIVSYLIILFLAIISSYFLYTGNTKLQSIFGGSVLVILLLYFTFFYRDFTIQFLILFTPISLPLGQQDGSIISFPSEIGSVLLLGVSALLLFMGKKINKKLFFHPISILLLTDLSIYLITSIFSTMPEISFKRLFLKTIFIGVYYFIFTHWFQKEKKYNRLFLLYSIGLIIPIIYTLVIHSKYNYSQFASSLMGKPFYAEHTIFGACIAFTIPFLTHWIITNRKSKRFFVKTSIITLLILIFTALILSYSRAAWVSLLVVILFTIGLKYKIKLKHIFLILITGSSLVYYNFDKIIENAESKEIKTSDNVLQHFSTIGALQNEASNQERINRWVSATYMFQEKPILGFGPGTYQFKYGPYQSLKYKTRISTSHGNKGTAHSEYFTALSETGIFGLLIFLGILFYSLNLGIKIYYKIKGNSKYKIAVYGAMCGLITFYVHGLFNNFLDTEKMSLLFYGSLAILVAIDFKITEEIKSNSPTI